MEYKKYLYAAYGSNLNLEQMKHRCPSAEYFGTTIISDSTLIFKSRYTRAGGVLDIVKCKGSKTPVALFKITQKDEEALDVYEGFPSLYVKKKKIIELHGVRYKIMFYVMNKEVHSVPCLPSVYYYNTVVEGYADNNFDVSNICKCFRNTVNLLSKF